MQKLLQFLIFCLTYGYYVILLKSLRFRYVGREAFLEAFARGLNPVIATPHCVLLPVILGFDKSPTLLLVSRSRDGGLIADILNKRGFKVVRGSSNRGGAAALKELIANARQGLAIGVAFDGPKGPPLVPKAGVAHCAKQANGPFFFIYAKPVKSFLSHHIKLKSWDRMLLPLPFMKVEITCEVLPIEMPLQDNRSDDLLAQLERRAKEVFADWYDLKY